MITAPLPRFALGLALAALGAGSAVPALAADPGKRACIQDAHRLCQPEFNSMRRSRVEACLIAKIDQTSAICHSTMLQIKVQREAADRQRAASVPPRVTQTRVAQPRVSQARVSQAR